MTTATRRRLGVWAACIGIPVWAAEILHTLCEVAADAQTEEHNTGLDSGWSLLAVESYAECLGLKVDWPGLYPVFSNSRVNQYNVAE